MDVHYTRSQAPYLKLLKLQYEKYKILLLERSTCELESKDLLQKCKEAIVSTKLKNYDIKMLPNEPMGNVKTYSYELPLPTSSLKWKEKIVTACKCPTKPATYLLNRSIKKKTKMIAQKLKRSMKKKL